MSSIQERSYLIKRIAQAVATSPASTPSSATAIPSVSGSPTTVDIATFFPSISLAWGANNLSKIQNIVNAINFAIYVLSAGQADFNTFRLQYFNIDPDQYPDQTLQGIIRLAQVLYNRMLTNHAQPFKTALAPQDKQQIIRQVMVPLNSSMIPSGGINAYLQSKVGAFKETLNSVLATIT